MEILLTSVARRQLLTLVAELRATDREQALRLVDGVETQLRGLAEDDRGGTDADPERAVATAGDGVRLYWWTRPGALWLLALSHPLLQPAP